MIMKTNVSETICLPLVYFDSCIRSVFVRLFFYCGLQFSSSNSAVVGPALPPGYKRGEPSSSSDESEQEVAVKRVKTGHAGEERAAEWVSC